MLPPFDDRVLRAASEIHLEKPQARFDATAIHARIGGDEREITRVLRQLAGEGYIDSIDSWQGVIVTGITYKGREQLVAPARASRVIPYVADRVLWPLVVGLLLIVIAAYIGLR
jgi:hypothetical protein